MIHLKAKEIMCKNIFYASYDDSILRCACILKENNIGFLPIEKEGTLIGVITDRDLCIRGIIEENNIHNPVENILSKQPIVVDQETSILDVLKAMEIYRIKRVLVHKNRKIVGVISLSDLLNIESCEKEILTTIQKNYSLDQIQTMEEPKVDEFYL